jgi:hypothetical protein
VTRRDLLALAASTGIAAGAALGGCSDDIATVDKAKVEHCLADSGAAPRPFLATSAHAPSEYRALIAENGARGALAARGGAPAVGDAWAYLFFFNGSERARAVYDRLAHEDKVKIAPARGAGRTRTVPATRRQNVIVLFGRRRAYGRGPGSGDRKTLERCFDRAS